MASEDWFLRLDPYNFNTEEEFVEFWSNDDIKPNSIEVSARINEVGAVNHKPPAI